MTERLFPLFSVLLIAVMVLAACAQPTPTEAPAEPEAPVAIEAPVETYTPSLTPSLTLTCTFIPPHTHPSFLGE